LIFKVILTRKSVGIRFSELFNLQIEKLEVALCPSKFRLSIVDSIHTEDYKSVGIGLVKYVIAVVLITVFLQSD